MAIGAYDTRRADRIIGEVNQGGALVESTLRTVRPGVSYRAVHASRGKVTRAEPVAAFYEQQRVHHVGLFRELEDQMTAFTSDFDRRRAGYSPDRVDALVWALTELLPVRESGITAGPLFGGLPRLRIEERFSPETLAQQGIFNPVDRAEWIKKGALKPDGSPTKAWNGESL